MGCDFAKGFPAVRGGEGLPGSPRPAPASRDDTEGPRRGGPAGQLGGRFVERGQARGWAGRNLQGNPISMGTVFLARYL